MRLAILRQSVRGLTPTKWRFAGFRLVSWRRRRCCRTSAFALLSCCSKTSPVLRPRHKDVGRDATFAYPLQTELEANPIIPSTVASVERVFGLVDEEAEASEPS